MDANAALQYGDSASAALNGVGVPPALNANYNRARTQYQTDLNSEQAAEQPAMQRYRATTAQPMPDVPDPKRASPAPDAAQFNKDAQGWVSALAVLSSLIGARGRARGTGALKAFAGGMKGLQEGNQQAFDNAYKTWKAESDAMFKEHDEEMEKYQAVLKNRDLTEAEQVQEINMIGHGYQNKLTMDAKDMGQAGAMVDSAVKAELGARSMVEKIEARKAAQDAIQAEQDKKINNVVSSFDKLQPTDIVPGFGLTKAAVMDKVHGLDSGLNYSDVGISMRTMNNPLRDLVDSVRSANSPTDRAQAKLEYLGKQQEERVGAKNLESMEVATTRLDRSLPLLMEQVRAVDPGRFKSWNEFENYLAENTGDPKIVKLRQAVQDTKTDFQVVQAKGGQITDRVRADSDAILNSAWATGQFEGAVDIMQKTSKNQMAAAKQAVSFITNGNVNEPTPTAGAPAGVAAPDFRHLWSGGD
jgi:hypothetical protein